MAGDSGIALRRYPRVTGMAGVIVAGALLTVVGFNLRSVILAVPPILALIRQDLGLSYTAIGLLTALPVLVMGGFAWPAGLLAGRIGARRAVLIGLVLLSGGALLRAVVVAAAPLFVFTFILSLGIALAQTASPVLVRQWFPDKIGLVSALFSDGLIIGESVAAGVTVPIMHQFFGADAWPATFVVWSVPCIVVLALWALLAPPAPATIPRTDAASPARAWVERKAAVSGSQRVSALHLGILLGSGSLIYFGMNGWIANYNKAIGVENLTPLTLAILNSAQLPSSFAVTVFAQRLAGRRWPFIAAGGICVISMLSWVLTPRTLEPLWAGLIGSSSAFVFVLGMALPPLLAAHHEVARLTGLTLTISYGLAFVGPLLGGGLWDRFGVPTLAFLPVGMAGVILIVLGALLPARSAFGLLDHIERVSAPGENDLAARSTPHG